MTKKNELVERMEAASPAGQSAQPTVVELLERQVPEIEKAVGDVVTARRLARLMASEIRANPGLSSDQDSCTESLQRHGKILFRYYPQDRLWFWRSSIFWSGPWH